MKRDITCGSTPMTRTDTNGAPVARTASTCFIDISSIASVKSLPIGSRSRRRSARACRRARRSPTALTNRIATITGWNERASSAISARAAQPAAPASGCARPRARAAATAGCRRRREHGDLRGSRACRCRAAPRRAKLGGNIREKKRRAVSEADHEARPRDVECAARVDDVQRRAATGRHARQMRAGATWSERGTRAATLAGRHELTAAILRRRRSAADVHRAAPAAGRRTRSRPSTCRRCGRRSAARARRRAC